MVNQVSGRRSGMSLKHPFTTMVVMRQLISSATLVPYLKESADAITGLSLTAANYEEAVAVLKARFGNKQRIVNRHGNSVER